MSLSKSMHNFHRNSRTFIRVLQFRSQQLFATKKTNFDLSCSNERRRPLSIYIVLAVLSGLFFIIFQLFRVHKYIRRSLRNFAVNDIDVRSSKLKRNPFVPPLDRISEESFSNSERRNVEENFNQ
jgi:hypothetical protein